MAPITKRKRETATTLDFKDVRQKIRSLEAGLNDKSNLNNIVDLIAFAQPEQQPKVIHAAIYALHRVFTHFLSQGELQKETLSTLANNKKKKTISAMEKYQQEQKDNNNKDKPLSAAQKVTLWLREQYQDYLDILRTLIDNDEPGLQLPAMNLTMAMVRSESEANQRFAKSRSTFANPLFGRMVHAMLTSSHFIGPLQKEFVDKYVNVYDDVRFYFFKDCAEIIDKALLVNKQQQKNGKRQKTTNETQLRTELDQLLINSFSVAELITSMPTESSELDDFWSLHPNSRIEDNNKDGNMDDMDAVLGGSLSDVEENDDDEKSGKKVLPSLLQLKVHKREFSKGWLAILRLPMTEEYYRRVLLIVHKRILPHLNEPRLLMDFLTDAYNVGGAISLLALNGIFTLITEHNLDYPDFYHKLYSLLDRNLLHMKYRSRFFRLLDIFLSSAYLPAALIAAFIKRLARLSLTAPPAASVIIVPFIYNLMKRHPTCMKMIHSQSATPSTDPFDFDTLDPYQCHAIDSSLWELQTLSQHYYANVSTLAKIFTEQFLKPKYNLEDFLDHTYATFFKTEIERKRKKTPALAIEKPTESVWSL
ncbi:CBF/Mak21 family-domain-containing protein [Halteromyces radiatus]|uniref:CBF/Mak21 family-domain-containing protein n=1 Tax=Halteromyces radiatus TaxID=101107 RepID=UPI00221FEFA3|nr:CBF/Mak21 family-domain-containing protein [Halteromyces radiatus]KAI8092693.1 CBF/Mak21 family-domain-containing protein [Halteromyces radiatus]